ncbi:MAG TPA: universal stress protein [Longimicrobiales bacterium]|nr:universal stress protein [Longimicrobiales bacterium]
MQIERIVLTTDYSEGSAAAVPAAEALAAALGAELVVLHVAERLVDVVPVAAGIPPVELQSDEALNERARQKLHAWADEHLTGDSFRVELVEGAAADEIARYAMESGAGLVVMGTQGHSRLERFFTGSVTEEVMRTSTVPVLVVPAPDRGRGRQGRD